MMNAYTKGINNQTLPKAFSTDQYCLCITAGNSLQNDTIIPKLHYRQPTYFQYIGSSEQSYYWIAIGNNENNTK